MSICKLLKFYFLPVTSEEILNSKSSVDMGYDFDEYQYSFKKFPFKYEFWDNNFVKRPAQ